MVELETDKIHYSQETSQCLFRGNMKLVIPAYLSHIDKYFKF